MSMEMSMSILFFKCRPDMVTFVHILSFQTELEFRDYSSQCEKQHRRKSFLKILRRATCVSFKIDLLVKIVESEYFAMQPVHSLQSFRSLGACSGRIMECHSAAQSGVKVRCLFSCHLIFGYVY